MSDILLLNLPFTSIGYKTMNEFASRSFPLGLGMLSGILKNKDLSFKVLDADVFNMDISEILTRVNKLKPRIIGMSTYSSHANMTRYLVKEIKKTLKNSIIVLGGHHAFAMRGELLNETTADIVAIGEGELIFSDLCDAILNNKSLDDVLGICFRKQNRVVYTGDREYIKNLDDIPMPAYEYFPMDRYQGHFYRKWVSGYRKPFTNIMASRGCPFQCGFCANKMWGRNVRFQSPERVIRDIDYLVSRYGIRQLAFFDDTFTLDMKRAHRICDLLIERDYRLDIACATRIGFLDEAIIKKMARSGFNWIAIGIESGNERILKKISKEQSLKKCSQVLKLIANNDIAVYGNFILGYPEEDKKTLNDTLSFMLKNPIHLPQLNIFVPYPHTPIYNELVTKGIIPPKNISQLSKIISYNKGISTRYLLFFQWYCYIRTFFRIRYFKLIRKTFKLKIFFLDLIRIGWAIFRLNREKKEWLDT